MLISLRTMGPPVQGLRQASTVDLSIEIGAGQGAVQGSDRILGAALFHAGLALGLSRRDEAGRRLRCARTAFRCELGMEGWRLASASGADSTVKPKPPTRPSSGQSLTTISNAGRRRFSYRQAASRERLPRFYV